METNKNKENPGGGFQNALITIISVLVYLAYILFKKAGEFIKGFPGSAKKFKDSEVYSIMCVIATVVFIVMLWPVSLAIILTVIITILGIFGSSFFGDWR